jgi:hypothetical protein
MSEGELGRVKNDLAVMRQAMGLHLAVGKGTLLFGILLAAMAASAAVASLFIADDRIQTAPVTVILVLVLVGAYWHSRRSIEFSGEIMMQVMVYVAIYAVVWVAACGYSLEIGRCRRQRGAPAPEARRSRIRQGRKGVCRPPPEDHLPFDQERTRGPGPLS